VKADNAVLIKANAVPAEHARDYRAYRGEQE
jgi:hypothetical protein